MAFNNQPVRILYQAKNATTGLTDVKGDFYLNGVAKAVGGSALAFSELDSTNSPGLYELVIPAATLVTWGVSNAINSTWVIEGYIDSASKPAPAPFRQEYSWNNIDDVNHQIGSPVGASISADIAAVQTKLGTPAGASVSADVAAVKADTAAIKVDLESGSASLATILSNIQALANGSISNGVGYVLPNMLIPSAGSTSYRIPVTIMNNDGALIDPTSNLVTVGLLNAGGADRGSYLVGSSGSPATVAATRDSLGQYHVMVSIPNTAVEEDLIFSFAYTIGSNAMVRYGQTQLLTDIGAAGLAQQSTLLATQTTVNAIDAVVTDATFGNAAIQALLANGTYGLSAIQAMLANGTYGLSALQSDIAAVTTELNAMEGVGFVSGSDSLHAISSYLLGNVYFGGRAF